MSGYHKQTWLNDVYDTPADTYTIEDLGGGQYRIKRAGNRIQHGTPLSSARMNHLESQAEAVVGTADSDLTRLRALMVAEDTRSWVVTDWDADDRETRVEIRAGAQVLCDITLAYNSEGRVTEAVVTVNGTQITYTWTYDGDRWAGRSKVVSSW